MVPCPVFPPPHGMGGYDAPCGGGMYVCKYVHMYAWMYVSIYVCMYACMHVCMYACMYVCIFISIYMLHAFLYDSVCVRTRIYTDM